MKILFLIVFFLGCVTPLSAFSEARQSHPMIHQVALEFARQQTLNLPGKVNIKIQDIDSRVVLPACQKLEAFLPSGARIPGKTSIGVRCNEKPGWNIFVQADIRVSVELLVSNKPLMQGSVLSRDDYALQSGEMGQPGLLFDPLLAVGKTLKYSIGAGQVLRLDMLREPFAIFQGQTVKLQTRGNGYLVSTEGLSMNDAAVGQGIKVKVASGQLISAIATADGNASVKP